MLEKIRSKTQARASTEGRSSDEKEPRVSSEPAAAESRKVVAQGRGGAGNISQAPAQGISSADLATPTLKGEFFTTGRGGTGNMTKNTDPEDARRAQDVTPLVRHETNTNVRIGRGGAANVAQVPQEELERSQTSEQALANKTVETNVTEAKSPISLADKGKNWLLGLGKKGNKSASS